MRYRISPDSVEQSRVHPDGTETAPRPFVRATGVRGIATDDAGGVWVVTPAGATRHDSAGRATHVLQES